MPVTGPACALVALIVGIVVGERRGAGSAGAVFAAGIAAGAIALLAARAPTRVRFVAVVLACGLLGVSCMQRALHGLERAPMTDAVVARADVAVVATLVDDPESTRWSASVPVRVGTWWRDEARAAVRDAGGRRLVARASGHAAIRLGLLEAGDEVALRGWVAPLSGYDTRERWRHAIGVIHAREVTAAARARSPLARLANASRAVVLAGTVPMAPVERAVVAGFLLGDTRALPPDVEEQFRAAGMTHLTAVSGGNVAFVLALAAPLLHRLRLGGRVVASGAVLVLFGTMTRWEPSVARAIAMTSIALVAGYLGRPTAGLRALLLAATVLLVVDPFLLHSVGFLLSCTASLGIALWAAPIAHRLRGPAWLREVLAVTAAAQLGVAPVLVPVFGSLPLVAVPANLVAVPLAAPLTMWGIASGVASAATAPVTPAVADVLAVPTVALVRALLAVADIAARVPVTLDAPALIAAGAVVALLAALRKARILRRDASALPPR